MNPASVSGLAPSSRPNPERQPARLALASIILASKPVPNTSRTFLRECGAQVGALRGRLPAGPNVHRPLPQRMPPARKRVILAPHLDTVSVGGMTIDPFGGEIRDGKALGPRSHRYKRLHGRDALEPLTSFASASRRSATRSGLPALWARRPARKGARAFVKGLTAPISPLSASPPGRDIVYIAQGRPAGSSSAPPAMPSTPPRRSLARTPSTRWRMFSAAFATRSPCGWLPNPIPYSVHRPSAPGPSAAGRKRISSPDCCELEVDCRTIPGQDSEEIHPASQGRFPWPGSFHLALRPAQYRSGASAGPASSEKRQPARRRPLVLRCRRLRGGGHPRRGRRSRLHRPGPYE